MATACTAWRTAIVLLPCLPDCGVREAVRSQRGPASRAEQSNCMTIAGMDGVHQRHLVIRCTRSQAFHCDLRARNRARYHPDKRGLGIDFGIHLARERSDPQHSHRPQSAAPARRFMKIGSRFLGGPVDAVRIERCHMANEPASAGGPLTPRKSGVKSGSSLIFRPLGGSMTCCRCGADHE